MKKFAAIVLIASIAIASASAEQTTAYSDSVTLKYHKGSTSAFTMKHGNTEDEAIAYSDNHKEGTVDLESDGSYFFGYYWQGNTAQAIPVETDITVTSFVQKNGATGDDATVATTLESTSQTIHGVASTVAADGTTVTITIPANTKVDEFTKYGYSTIKWSGNPNLVAGDYECNVTVTTKSGT